MEKKILLVDDEALVALAAAETLEKEGYSVTTVYTGEKAVEAVERDDDISLVLMDIDLGSGIDGTEAARRILVGRELPILFHTGHAEEAFVNRVEAISGYGYILKDSGKFVLIQSVKMALELFEARCDLRDLNMEKERYNEELRTTVEELEDTNRFLIESRERYKSSERKYRLLFENLTTAFALHEMVYRDGEPVDYRFLSVNPAFEKMTGLSAEAIIGRTVLEVLPGTEPKWIDTYHRVVQTGEPIEFESYARELHRYYRVYAYRPEAERFAVIFSDITEQERLRIRTQKIIDNAPFVINEISLEGFYEMVNKEACRFYGRTSEALIGRRFEDLLPADQAARFKSRIARILETREALVVDDSFTVEGRERIYRTRLFPLTGEQDRIRSIVGIGYDITEEMRADGLKDSFMRELNHRVKNSLNMIASLVKMKEREASCDLSDLVNQIAAVGLVYEKLSRTDGADTILIADYLRELLGAVFSIFSPIPVKLLVEAEEELTISAEKAVPLGMIANEIATNAIKYGFSDNDSPRFRVELTAEPKKGGFRLILENNGNPFPEAVRLDTSQSLGMRLIQGLTRQLDGTVLLSRSPSARFTIEIPVDG